MEVEFRESGHLGQFLQFHLAMQIPAKMVDDPINSLGIFAVGLGLLAWQEFCCHRVIVISQWATRSTTTQPTIRVVSYDLGCVFGSPRALVTAELASSSLVIPARF